MAKRSRKSRKMRVSKPVAPIAPVASPQVKAKNDSNGVEVDFTKDYFYVFTDMRMMLVITILMVGLMVGLSYVI